MNRNDGAQDRPTLTGELLCHGQASGPTAVLREALSFWGGFDSTKGVIVERGHPCFGESLAGRILVMPRAKGSSSSSSVLAEAIRNGTGPAGIILMERDLIISIGVIVARELYGIEVPLVVVGAAVFETVCLSKSGVRIVAGEGAEWAEIELEL